MAILSSPKQFFWQETSILSFALVALLSVILWPLAERGVDVYIATILAGTSGVLLAMSFSLSSFSYYFDFLDRYVVYRKYLGLMGYFFALGYILVIASLNPSKYLYSFPDNLQSIEVGLGALAMAIFTLMALISNNKAVQLLGGKLWKNILGLGYVAYAILVIRAIFLDAYLWTNWFTMDKSVFTARMGLTVLGTAVLLFRASVPFHKKFFKKDSYV